MLPRQVKTLREIKFRGISTDEKVWIYGNLLISQNPRHNFETLIIPQEKCNSYMAIIPSTVGQYTGLKDRQGVEIYEGDVLDYDNGIGIKGIVKWYKDGFAIRILGAGDASNKSLYQSTEDIEVIGNIHENPELLKEGEANASN